MKIPLTQGEFAIIDDEDAEKVIGIKWSVVKPNPKNWYARNSKHGYLHRFLMDAPEGMTVDHKDGNGLDCRRSNMRIVPHGLNIANKRKSSNNTSGYTGVTFCKQTGKWRANIMIDRKYKCLGRYDTPELASEAYQKAKALRF
jgi:hypothetical protein